MTLNPAFEIMQVADDYMAVPLGDEAQRFRGVVALSEPAAYLLKKMDVPRTEDDLVRLLTEEYDVAADAAREDVRRIVQTFLELGVIEP